MKPRLPKRRWLVEWQGVATLHGFTLAAADPVHSQHWTQWGANRRKAQLEAEHRIREGSAGCWVVRQA